MPKNHLTNIRQNDKMDSVNITYVNESGNIAQKKIHKAKKTNTLLDSKYWGMGYYLATPLLLGVVAGIFLDKWLNTKPVFTLLFIVLGTIATFYNLFKILKDG